jgi:hypothetical protein
MCKNKTTEQPRARYVKATVSGMRQEGAKRRELHVIVKLLHGSYPVHKTIR